jgi:hypothetical protein
MLGWLALLMIAIVLALGLGIALGRLWAPGTPAPESLLVQLWRVLTPDFAQFEIERVTAQTMRLLVAAMLIFGCVAATWAAGAGVMRTAWLFAAKPDDAAAGLKDGLWLPSGSLLIGILVWQVIRAVGGVLLIGLGAGLAGAMLGFIFGIPRPLSAPEAPPALAGGAAPPPGVDPHQAREAWKLSTNLTDISDWLTKAIVGVGLVEAKNAVSQLVVISVAAADWLFSKRHGSPALITATIVGSGVFGFLFAYLYTELIVSRLIAAVAGVLGATPVARQTLRRLPLTQAIAPRIPRAGPPETDVQPTIEQIRAALQYDPLRFEDLVSRPDVTDEEILNWSRAKAVLNDYHAAAQGYMYLLTRWLVPRAP